MEIKYKVYFTSTGDRRGTGNGVGDVTVECPTPCPEPFDPAHHEDTRAYRESQGYQGVQITWRESIR